MSATFSVEDYGGNQSEVTVPVTVGGLWIPAYDGPPVGLTGPTIPWTASVVLTEPVSISDRAFSAGVIVDGCHVVLRNCEVDGAFSASWGIQCVNGGTVDIADMVIHGANSALQVSGTVARVEVYDCEDALRPLSGFHASQVWCHDLDWPVADPHRDGVQVTDGTGFVFEYCHFDATDIPFFVKPDFGDIDGVTLRDSYLNGGGWQLDVSPWQNNQVTNLAIFDNVFGPDYGFGHASIDQRFAPYVWYGNVDTNGDPI